MKINNGKDFWASLMFIATGVFFVIASRAFPMGTAVRMGPAYFPSVLGGLLVVLGFAILVRAFVSKVHHSIEAFPFRWPMALVGCVLIAIAWASAKLFASDFRPQTPSSMTSDQCLTCHFYIREVDEIVAMKLPKDLRPIKLRAGHSQHWDYRVFTSDQRDKLNALTAKKAKLPLAKSEQDQLDRLSQIEKMQCYRCHERFKKESPGGIDANINIAMKNPMECTECHIALRTAVHPGDGSPLPSAVSCERCHHGELHQKMIFFPLDHGTDADCLRCHPGYTPEELLAAKPAQFSHKSTGQPAAKSQILNSEVRNAKPTN